MRTTVKILISVSGLCLFSLFSVADDLCGYCGDYRNLGMGLPEKTVPKDKGCDQTAVIPERIAVRSPVHIPWINITDGLCTYCEDMSAHGTPRSNYITPHQMPVVGQQETAPVSPVVMLALVQAVRSSAATDLCDYCEDPKTYLHRVSKTVVQSGQDKPGFVNRVEPMTPDSLAPRTITKKRLKNYIDGLCDYCEDFSHYVRSAPILLHAEN